MKKSSGNFWPPTYTVSAKAIAVLATCLTLRMLLFVIPAPPAISVFLYGVAIGAAIIGAWEGIARHRRRQAGQRPIKDTIHDQGYRKSAARRMGDRYFRGPR